MIRNRVPEPEFPSPDWEKEKKEFLEGQVHRVQMNDPDIKKCIDLLESQGYKIEKISEKDKMIENIMKAYDSFNKKEKKEFIKFVMMLKFIDGRKNQFENFCFREGVSLD